MRVVCTKCKQLYEIYDVKDAQCPNLNCKSLMSPFQKDILEVLVAEKLAGSNAEEEGAGL